MQVTEKYKHDKELEIPNVYKTSDDAHPGVKIVRGQGNFNLAGPIDVITPTHEPEFADYRRRLPRRAKRSRRRDGQPWRRSRREIRFTAAMSISPRSRWR
jgi:ATP sulfurylase